jgi:hypothetical protein
VRGHVPQLVAVAPRHPEQITAVVEIVAGPRELDPWDVEAIADRWCDRAALPLDHPDPWLRAIALEFSPFAVPGFIGRGAYCDGVIYYRPYADRRRRGWILTHETAEGICDREKIHPPHPDINRIALAMTAPRSWLRPALKRFGAAGTTRQLCRSNPHAPTELLRMRVELFAMLTNAL